MLDELTQLDDQVYRRVQLSSFHQGGNTLDFIHENSRQRTNFRCNTLTRYSFVCLQVFKASRPGIPLRVYFLIYSGSVEEQVSLSYAQFKRHISHVPKINTER